MNSDLKISERDRELFNKTAARYARKDITKSSIQPRHYQVRWAVDPVIEKLGSSITIVELGCGVAAPAKYLAGRYKRYIGVDYSAEMIRAAQIFHKGNSKVEVVVDDVMALSIPANIADLVLAVGVFHHIPNIDKAFGSVLKIGKPGGYLVVIEPQRANPVIQMLRWLRGFLDSSYSREQRFFSKQELITLCESAGFENIKVEHQGFLSKPFGQIVLSPLFAPLSKLAVAIDRVLDEHLPQPFRFLSWDLVVRAQFPLESTNKYD